MNLLTDLSKTELQEMLLSLSLWKSSLEARMQAGEELTAQLDCATQSIREVEEAYLLK